MGHADYLSLGDWNALCFFCNKKYKANELKKYWTGVWVCPKCWEPRQPQDFVRGIPDDQAPPWIQPDIDILVSACAIVDEAIVDIAIVDVAY